MRYGALNGSTTTVTPSHSNTWSPSWAPRSKPSPYWKPEQPPPSIATRSTETSASSSMRARILTAAAGVSETRLPPSSTVRSWTSIVLACYQPGPLSPPPEKGGLCNTRRTVEIKGSAMARNHPRFDNVSPADAARLASFPHLRPAGAGHPGVDDRDVLCIRAAARPAHARPGDSLRVGRLRGPDAPPAIHRELLPHGDALHRLRHRDRV